MPFDSTRDQLIRARSLIDHPDKWIQGTFRRGGRMCTMNALSLAATGQDMGLGSHGPTEKLVRALGYEHEADVCTMNNLFTHDQVMAKFDAAISRQQQGEVTCHETSYRKSTAMRSAIEAESSLRLARGELLKTYLPMSSYTRFRPDRRRSISVACEASYLTGRQTCTGT